MLSVTKLDETRLIFVLASSGRRGPRFKSGLPDITGFRLRKPVFCLGKAALQASPPRRFIDEPKWTAFALHF